MSFCSSSDGWYQEICFEMNRRKNFVAFLTDKLEGVQSSVT